MYPLVHLGPPLHAAALTSIFSLFQLPIKRNTQHILVNFEIVWQHLFCNIFVECPLFCAVDGCLKPFVSFIVDKIEILQSELIVRFKKETQATDDNDNFLLQWRPGFKTQQLY
jgi:hypothetical protein